VRKGLFVIPILLSSVALAQNNLSDTTKAFVTPVGNSLGDITTVSIDRSGGTVRSNDGKLEIIFPADALDSKAQVSIQAIHNELTDDDNGSYQLEPSGLTFKKPVQLIFHYTDGNENADLKSIAWQDDSGKWHWGKNIFTDTIQKTVSCSAEHFSRWAKFDKISLSPGSATVKVSKTVSLHIISFEDLRDRLADELTEPAAPTSDDDLLATPHKQHYYSGEWTANGIVNGNVEVGVVTKDGNRDAKYKAPAVVPTGNPVAVSVQIFSDQKNKKLLLTSNITVVGDQYHFTYIHIDENGCYFMVDSSSCIFNMEKDKVRVSNIINYKPWSDWPDCGGCHYEWTNKATVKGLAEINGIASSVITPPKEGGGPVNVSINFLPAIGNTPSATVHCKGGDHNIPSMSMPAVPSSVSFDIDGDDVVIHYAGKTSRNELVIEARNEKTMIYIYKLTY
jgi:hypothetical protein